MLVQHASSPEGAPDSNVYADSARPKLLGNALWVCGVIVCGLAAFTRVALLGSRAVVRSEGSGDAFVMSVTSAGSCPMNDGLHRMEDGFRIVSAPLPVSAVNNCAHISEGRKGNQHSSEKSNTPSGGCRRIVNFARIDILILYRYIYVNLLF